MQANTLTYYVAEDGTLRNSSAGSIPQTPSLYYGCEYTVTLSFPAGTLAANDQLQVAINKSRTFFSSASATGDAPVAAVTKHTVTAEEASANAVSLTLSTNTRAMIDQVNGIDHPVRGFFGVHILRGQSFVTLAVADALMMSLESGPDAISPSLPVEDYPTREEINAIVDHMDDQAQAAADAAESAGRAKDAAETAAGQAEGSATAASGSATLAESYAVGGTGTRPGEDTDNAKYYLEQLGDHEANAAASATEAAAWAEGTPQQVSQYGGMKSAKGWATDAQTAAGNAADSETAAANAKTAAETAQGKAETAQGKAEDAQTAAETAQGKAEDAQTAAEAAQTAAETAQGKAETAETNAAGSASDASSYATAAAGSASAALASATKAAIVTEGTDEQVAEYGLEHSAQTYAGIAQEAAEDATAYLDVITIPSSTAAYTLQDNRNYEHKPSAVPTYTLPTVVFDNKKHEISLLVDFMHVTSCSFVDAGGVPVTLQSAISPQIGEAYIFRCYWYGKWRVVPLKIRNAATATSSNGVVEVSDAVAGDALSLKMTAPRSVVMNQLFDKATTDIGMINTIQYGTVVVNRTTGDITFTVVASSVSNGVSIGPSAWLLNGHVYAIKFNVLSSEATDAIQLLSISAVTQAPVFSAAANVKTTLTCIVEMTANTRLNIYNNRNGASVNTTFEISALEVVDLTQYFNGDSTLIDSIQSWDDLVAYDPRFASYVEYNTGTVEGVQPTVKVSGKNMCPFGTIAITATNGMSDSKQIELPPATYTLSALVTSIDTDSSYSAVAFAYYDGTYSLYTLARNTRASKTFTSAKRIVSMRLYSSDNANHSYGDTATWSQIQIELGSTPTSYEPYHSGGAAQATAPLFAVGNAADEFEAVSGATTRKMASVDLGTLTWTAYVEAGSGSVANTNAAVPSDGVFSGLSICSKYVIGTWGNFIEKTFVFNIGVNPQRIIVMDSALTGMTGAQVKQAMSGVMLYYKLAEPTTSQSPPTQISLQAGNNVAMQTDGGRTLGELSMTYENLPTE